MKTLGFLCNKKHKKSIESIWDDNRKGTGHNKRKSNLHDKSTGPTMGGRGSNGEASYPPRWNAQLPRSAGPSSNLSQCRHHHNVTKRTLTKQFSCCIRQALTQTQVLVILRFAVDSETASGCVRARARPWGLSLACCLPWAWPLVEFTNRTYGLHKNSPKANICWYSYWQKENRLTDKAENHSSNV